MKQLNIQEKNYIGLEYSFKEWLAVLGYAPTSVYGIPNYIREFLAWLEQQEITQIEDVGFEDVNTYFEVLRHRVNQRRDGGLSNNYISKHLQAVKLFSTYLRQTNQGGFLVEVKTPKQERKIKDVLTLEEIKCLYDVTSNDLLGLRDRAFLSLYYGCGLRRNEGIQMDIDDILFDRKMIYVRNGKNYTERYVPVNGQVLQYLADYVNSGRYGLLKRNRPTEALLLSARGERVGGQSLLIRLKQLKEKTGDQQLIRKEIGLHTLRHSIATHLLMGGMKLERISRFLGHKSIESTQIYAHIAQELENEEH